MEIKSSRSKTATNMGTVPLDVMIAGHIGQGRITELQSVTLKTLGRQAQVGKNP